MSLRPSSRAGGITLRRRTLLSGAAALVVAGQGDGGRALAAASARHDFTVGAVGVTVLSDGLLSLPQSLVLPAITRAELEVLLAGPVPADGFTAETNVTLLSAGDARILVDVGAGGNFMPTLGRLPGRLEAAGIDPASISHVVFTHAHPDHLWGAIDELDEPRFSNAVHTVSAAEWDYWRDPGTVTRTPETMQPMAAGAARILKALESRTERRHPGDSIVPGVSLLGTPGHTPGHVSVLVESDGEMLLVGGDVLTHSRVSFERSHWEWGTDADPARAKATREATLGMLAEARTPLLGYHLPWPGLGQVERTGSAYRFVPTPR